MGKRGISWMTIAIFIIILAIIVKFNLMGLIKKWIVEKYAFPEECKEVAPVRYKWIVYDYCNLKHYNVTLDDITVKTYYREPNTCHAIVYIKDKKVFEFSYTPNHGAYIDCEKIKQTWLSG